MYKKINIVPGIQKIWQPWHAFFGNPEKQNTDLKVFNHNYEETDVPFLIRVPIQFKIGQIIINMATLKIQIWVLIRNCPKTYISSTIFIICPAGTKMIVYMWKWFSSEGHWWESPSHIHNHLCFCRTYHENCWWNISFRAISNQNTNFNFQGCHIYGNLANFKLNLNPNQKKNIRFFIFMVKNP